MNADPAQRSTGRIAFGVLLVALGAAYLADNLGFIDHFTIGRFWPLILVAMGLVSIFSHGARRAVRVSGGWWLVFIGLWLFVSQNHVWGLSFRDSWPLLIIAWGASVVWRSVVPKRRSEHIDEKEV